MKEKHRFALLFSWAVLAFSTGSVAQETTAAALSGDRSGTIIGTVSSVETRNMLQGAVVALPAQRKQVFTDHAGRFVLTDVAVGATEIVVSYSGFDDHRQTLTVASSEPARLAVEMKASSALLLDAFTVSTEREGNALAITQQRNASNVKNVIAMDALSNTPNSNAGELLAQLPGVAANLNVEGSVNGVLIRGMPRGLTRMSVDGLPISAVGDRDAALTDTSSGPYEEMEVIKGQTPDQSADSLGGTVNLKTRSALSMNEKRRFNYNFAARWAPPFFYRTPMRAEHPIHPLTNFGYQEVFDVLGGSRNFAITLNLTYNEKVNTREFVYYDYGNLDQNPNYIWDYRTSNGGSFAHHVTNVNLKTEYRHSDTTKFDFGFIYNQSNEPSNYQKNTRAFTNQVVASLDANGQPTGTGGILPGFTENVTQVRGVAASFFEQTSWLPYQSFYSKTPTATFGGEHKFSRMEIDYRIRYSNTRYRNSSGKNLEGGVLVMRVPNVGWIIDRSDPENPSFVQTAGADIYDINSYTSNIAFSVNDTIVNLKDNNIQANFKYRFDTTSPFEAKAGLAYRESPREQRGGPRRWTRASGAPALPPSWASFVTVFDTLGGRRVPDVEKVNGIDLELDNPALWTEDLYYRESQKYILDYQVKEEVSAAYLMVQGKFDRFGYLAGVRGERTDVRSAGYIAGPLATAAQIPDPIQRAINDYNNPVSRSGSYDRAFPSAHFFYEFNKNLIGRASWSTSFGRPALAQLAPSATVSNTAQTVTERDAGIGPQYAENIDLSLEYYFEPAGVLSLGYFKKDIKDYIATIDVGTIGDGPNNGFNGFYSGYLLRTTGNAGSAKIEGWEFNYGQQLTFLPGLFRGIGLSANYTELRAEGDFGETATLRTNEVAGFIPKTGNAGVTYKYKKFGSRLSVNYVGDHLITYNSNPTARVYRKALTSLNVGFSYQLTPSISLYCEATNITEERAQFYRFVPSQIRESRRMQTAVTFGTSGRF